MADVAPRPPVSEIIAMPPPASGRRRKTPTVSVIGPSSPAPARPRRPTAGEKEAPSGTQIPLPCEMRHGDAEKSNTASQGTARTGVRNPEAPPRHAGWRDARRRSSGCVSAHEQTRHADGRPPLAHTPRLVEVRDYDFRPGPWSSNALRHKSSGQSSSGGRLHPRHEGDSSKRTVSHAANIQRRIQARRAKFHPRMACAAPPTP